MEIGAKETHGPTEDRPKEACEADNALRNAVCEPDEMRRRRWSNLIRANRRTLDLENDAL